MAFITQKDCEVLVQEGINIKTFENKFLRELKEILLVLWRKEFHIYLKNLENKSIDDFNKIINYPSHEGYSILEDTFTNVNEETINILSNQSKILIGYFYGIHFHNFD